MFVVVGFKTSRIFESRMFGEIISWVFNKSFNPDPQSFLFSGAAWILFHLFTRIRIHFVSEEKTADLDPTK